MNDAEVRVYGRRSNKRLSVCDLVPGQFTRIGNCRSRRASQRLARKGRASGARRSGRVRAGERRRGSSETLAAWKDRGRAIRHRGRRKLRRRGGQGDRGTPRARADAGARVVVVRRSVGGRMVAMRGLGARRRVMRMGRGNGLARRGRDHAAVHRTRAHNARLPDNQREPDGETGRQCAKPRRSSHAQ